MQILEGVRKCADAVLFQELLEANFVFCLLTDCVDAVCLHGILIRILLHLRVDFFFCYLIDDVYHIAQRIVVALPAIFDLALYTIAVGNCHMSHVISEGSYLQGLGVVDSLCYLRESLDLRYYVVMLIVSCNHLMGNTHSCYDEAKLTVAVCCLVQVHEVHIDIVIRKLLIGLCVQVKHGLSKLLQSLDPHLGRGEGVHPGNDADAVIVTGRFTHILDTNLRGLYGGKYFHCRDSFQLLIQELCHLTGVCRYLLQALFTIQILRTYYKIKFFHFSLPPEIFTNFHVPARQGLFLAAYIPDRISVVKRNRETVRIVFFLPVRILHHAEQIPCCDTSQIVFGMDDR